MRDVLRSRSYGFAVGLAALLLIANIVAQPSFAKPGNWAAELAIFAPFALVAMASTPAILSGGGGLDISVGPLAVVVNTMLIYWLLPHAAIGSWELAVPILLAFGAAIGAVNGILIARLRYQPVIATLCAFFVLSGVAVAIAPQPKTTTIGWLTSLGSSVGPIPGALILLAIPVAVWVALSRTPFHRALYGVGGNDAAAFSAGVNVTRVRIAAYALGGLFAAVAGIALTALTLSTQTDDGSAYTLIALAAVAIGGTPIAGGRGGLLGSVCGAICIYELQTLLSALNVSADWDQAVYGALLVVGVLLGARVQMAARSRGLVPA